MKVETSQKSSASYTFFTSTALCKATFKMTVFFAVSPLDIRHCHHTHVGPKQKVGGTARRSVNPITCRR